MAQENPSTSANPSDPIAAAKALADLRKAQADADSAEAAAATAKLKAAFGDAPSSPYAGVVTVGDGAGGAEMNLLARRALTTVAEQIAGKLNPLLDQRTGAFIGSAAPTALFGHDDALRTRIDLIREACERAQALCKAAAPPPDRGAGADQAVIEGLRAAITKKSLVFSGIAGMLAAAASPAGPIATIGAVATAATAALGLFRSNYTVGGAAISAPDRALIVAVAGLLRRDRANLPIAIDGLSPAASANARAELAHAIDDLSRRIAELGADAARLEPAIQAESGKGEPKAARRGAEAAPPEKDPAHADPPEPDVAPDPRQDALAAVKRAGAMFDALQTDLLADAGGAPLIARAAMERALRQRLGERALFVSLALDGAWGSRVTRESLFSGLSSRIPMQVSAAVAANWAALDLATGDVLAAGVETRREPMVEVANVGA